MELKNADMPAYPLDPNNVHAAMQNTCTDPDQKWHVAGLGMTKREMMAMNAPFAPMWFHELWVAENCAVAEYFGTTEDGHTIQTSAGHAAMFFAWRAYYADKMLAELESKS